MAGKQRVTMKRVAAEAGVSIQTVSRVINDHPDVASTTRRRIWEIVEQLGYQPNTIARSLIQGRSYTLGVVGYGLEHYGPSRILAGIEHQASELGYMLVFSLIRHPEDEAGPLLREMLSRYVDGVIWAVSEGSHNRERVQEELSSLSIPVVFLHTDHRPNLCVVDINNHEGARMATQHLLDQGYRTIGLINGPRRWWAGRQRELGWQDALNGAGLQAVESLVVEGDWSPASGECCLGRLLEQHPGVDAVFAGNDQMALGVLKAAREKGLRVPEDLAVVGFDDIPEAAYFDPPLTTVRQNLDEVGRCAVRELGQLIETGRHGELPREPRAIWLQPELVVRASSVAKR